jgi:hypothetical protein
VLRGRRIGLTAALALALGGCAAGGATIATPPAPKTAHQAVYAAEIGYAAVQRLAVRYSTLPRCGSAAAAGATISCSDTSVVDAMRAANKDVIAALDDAAAGAATMDASDSRFVKLLAGVSAAVQAMQTILVNHGITEAALG